MKKILLFLLVSGSLLLSNVYSYDLTQNDEDLVRKITNKIEDKIEKKWEDYREKYLEVIKIIVEKYWKEERIIEIINSINENIKTTANKEIQNKILAELDVEWLPDLKFLYSDESIKNMPFVFTRLIEEKKEKFKKLLSIDNDEINFSLIEDFNANDELWYLYSLLENYVYIDWKDNVVNVYYEFQAKLSELSNEINYSKEYYNIYKIVQEDDSLSVEQKRIIDRDITAFELEWINLSDDDILELKEINQELISLSSNFSENLLDSQRNYKYYIDNLEDIEEVPEDILKIAHEYALEEDKDWYLFNYNIASYLVSYSSNSDIRKEVRNDYKNFSYKWKNDNREIILDMLKLRQQKASLLWYNNYWEYSLADKMAISPEFVMEQENKILEKSHEKATEELNEIKEYFGLDVIEPWDYWYYSRILEMEKYEFDSTALRDYFEYSRVKEWLFDIANEIFWLEFVEINEEMYSDDVVAYEVYKDWDFKWYYIVDPFYNSNKSSWAWANTFRAKNMTSWNNKLPIVINVTNFSKAEDNTLLTYRSVTTMFHEFWHAIHALLWESVYPELNWFNVEWDFVELPSQLMENWAYWEWLKTFAYNYETWEGISDDLIAKIEILDTFSTWVWTSWNIMYSRIDMTLHTDNNINTIEDLDEVTYNVIDTIWVFKNDINNHCYTSFSHIFDWWYSAWYYSYLRAEIIESDVFSKFVENWIFDKQTADDYYNTILSQWSIKPAIELFKDFMWRDIELDGFYNKKGF